MFKKIIMAQEISLIGLSKKETAFLKSIFSKDNIKIQFISSVELLQRADLVIIGHDICPQIEEIKNELLNKRIPLLLYTDFDEDLIISCYQKGMDDFLDNQWSADLLIAKVEAWLSFAKKAKKEKANKIKLGNLSINLKKRKVTKKRNEIELTKIEYNILSLLAKDRTKVFSREEIYQQIWGDSIVVGERTLDVHMNNLRKKIGKSIIKTKKGVGFSINSNL